MRAAWTRTVLDISSPWLGFRIRNLPVREHGKPGGVRVRFRAMAVVVFFPEGAFGPTNNCVGIGDVLRQRGHRIAFIVEESFAGTLEAKGFEEWTMRLAPPPAEPEEPGQFWKDF